MIMEIRGHGGITHFGNSEGGGGGVKIWKSSVVWYGYFLESPNVTHVLPFCRLKYVHNKVRSEYI